MPGATSPSEIGERRPAPSNRAPASIRFPPRHTWISWGVFPGLHVCVKHRGGARRRMRCWENNCQTWHVFGFCRWRAALGALGLPLCVSTSSTYRQNGVSGRRFSVHFSHNCFTLPRSPPPPGEHGAQPDCTPAYGCISTAGLVLCSLPSVKNQILGPGLLVEAVDSESF